MNKNKNLYHEGLKILRGAIKMKPKTTVMTRLETRKSIIERVKNLDTAHLGAIGAILREVEKARDQHPDYPKDIIHRSAIVSEETGELTRACLQHKYEDGDFHECIKESIQVGAMAVRFITQR